MSFASRYKPNLKVDTRDVKRFEENLKKLEGMTVKKRREKMAQVARHALAPTKKAMVKNAQGIKKTGLLARSITNATYKRTGYGSVAGARTGPTIRGKSKNRAFHAHLVELGTKKKIKKVKGTGSFNFYSEKYGRRVKTKVINHGSRALPYIAPAWAATKTKVRSRMRDKMKTILDSLRKEIKQSS